MNERIFNTLAVLSLVGFGFIGCTVPHLIEGEPEEVLKMRRPLPQMFLSVPDYSPMVEWLDTKDEVNERLDRVRTLMEIVDSLKPEAEVLTKVYVGQFYLTYYAATIEQCGSTSGITASGRYCTEDPTCHTVAVDPKVIPLGTYLMIEGYDGIIFRADDTGGDIKNYWIDIYTDSEPLSKSFNPCYADVWIVEV